MADGRPDRVAGTELEIKATPEQVWRALTDAEQITRWFSLDARVEPGPGGTIWCSWGPGSEGGQRIEVWEPPRRLRTVEDPPETAGRPQRGPLTTDYILDGRGGTTRLRIVTSGFGDDSYWDDELDSMRRGWRFFGVALRHMLERHPSTTCVHLAGPIPFKLAPQEAWRRMLSAGGLDVGGNLADAKVGGAYTLRTAAGDELSGTVLLWNPAKDMALTVSSLNDALIWVGGDAAHGSAWAYVMLLAYGVPPAEAEGLYNRLRSLIAGLLQPEGSSATTAAS